MVRDAGGSRTHWRAALQAAAVPSGSSVTSVLARNRTWTSTFAGLRANPAHPEDVNFLAARRGVEPRLAVSRTAVRSGTLAGSEGPMHSATTSGHAEPTAGFAPASAGLQNRCLLQSSHVGDKHEREESNPVRQFWRLAALPGAHSCKRPRSCDRERNSFTSAIQRSSTRR